MKTLPLSMHVPICRSLRDARIKARMTQIQLARALGKPQTWVSKVESGERSVDVIETLQILDAIAPGRRIRLPPPPPEALTRG